jgi:gas vesicle protein
MRLRPEIEPEILNTGIVIVHFFGYLQNQKNMKDTSRVVAALLIGAAAGAALGLLLAPEKGEKVRDGIADFVNDLLESAKNKAQTATSDLKGYGVSAYDRAKSTISGMMGNVSDYKDDAISDVKSGIENVKDQAHSSYNGAKTKVKSTANDWNNSIQQA